jgi:hypothetical protein
LNRLHRRDSERDEEKKEKVPTVVRIRHPAQTARKGKTFSVSIPAFLTKKRPIAGGISSHAIGMSSLPCWTCCGILFLVTVLLTQAASEQPPSKTSGHAATLLHMPVALLHYSSVYPEVPDKNAPFQLGTMMKLAVAAAHGDQEIADECWFTVNITFAKQTKYGDLGSDPMATAVWLGEFTRSVLVIQQSPLAAHFKDRIEAIKPALTKAMHWLSKQRSRLEFEDRSTPDRLFSEAQAFLFSGRLLDDPRLIKCGHDFLDTAMKAYRPSDGAFLERSGTDCDYQAASLVRLQEIMLNLPDIHLNDALTKGVQWELAHIGADGTVHTDAKPSLFSHSKMIMGPEKQVNVGEISLALLYYHERTNDATSIAAVERLQKHYATSTAATLTSPPSR